MTDDTTDEDEREAASTLAPLSSSPESETMAPPTVTTSMGSLVLHHAQLHRGPLPDPETLRQYRDLSPEYADIIVRAFEAEGDHRRAIEQAESRADIEIARNGQRYGFLIIGLIIALAAFAIWRDYAVAGVIVAIGSLFTLLLVFMGQSAKKQPTKTDNERDDDDAT